MTAKEYRWSSVYDWLEEKTYQKSVGLDELLLLIREHVDPDSLEAHFDSDLTEDGFYIESFTCPACNFTYEGDEYEATCYADHGLCDNCFHEVQIGEICRYCYSLDHDWEVCPETELEQD